MRFRACGTLANDNAWIRLEEILLELDGLIGLNIVKQDVRQSFQSIFGPLQERDKWRVPL